MFYTNKQVVDKLNLIYGGHIARGGSQFNLPDKELMLDKLKNREVVIFFYLTQQITPASSTADNIPEVSLVLESFFIHPYGDKLWSNDQSLKYLTMAEYAIPQDVCTNIMNVRFTEFTKIIPKTIEEFAEHLNK
jgi:hypothetical protein